jgi:hypothetical protein
MASKNHNFRPAELTNAVKAVSRAGLPVDHIRIEIDPTTGRIVITTGQASTEHSDFDTWVKKHARQA